MPALITETTPKDKKRIRIDKLKRLVNITEDNPQKPSKPAIIHIIYIKMDNDPRTFTADTSCTKLASSPISRPPHKTLSPKVGSQPKIKVNVNTDFDAIVIV